MNPVTHLFSTMYKEPTTPFITRRGPPCRLWVVVVSSHLEPLKQVGSSPELGVYTLTHIWSWPPCTSITLWWCILTELYMYTVYTCFTLRELFWRLPKPTPKQGLLIHSHANSPRMQCWLRDKNPEIPQDPIASPRGLDSIKNRGARASCRLGLSRYLGLMYLPKKLFFKHIVMFLWFLGACFEQKRHGVSQKRGVLPRKGSNLKDCKIFFESEGIFSKLLSSFASNLDPFQKGLAPTELPWLMEPIGQPNSLQPKHGFVRNFRFRIVWWRPCWTWAN